MKTALLIIDQQKGIDHPKLGLRNNPQAEEVMLGVLSRWRQKWRQNQWPIGHIKHRSKDSESVFWPHQTGFEFKNEFNIDENHPIPTRFANHYAKTKYLGEQIVINQRNNVEVVIIRPRGIVGDGDKSIMPRIIRVAKNGFFPLLNNGEAIVDVTYVKNVVEGLLLCASTKNIDGEVFNISNDQPMKVSRLLNLVLKDKSVRYLKLPYALVFSFAWLLERMSKLVGGDEPKITMYGIGLLAHTQVLNIDKAKELLGYKPIYSIEDAVDKYLEWEDDRA